ncbi:MAG: amino acid ABC transporter permease [Acetobacteraceae bacterium]|nr:amino acid ABC transporter permease [Acetobacteraceae bacterium]
MQLLVSAFPALLEGAQTTIAASLMAIVLGLGLGITLALVRQSRRPALRRVVSVYVSFARGTPLFIQILVVFFVLPELGLDISKFYAGVIALSLNSGAYIAEMIRGGLTSIPHGQGDAAKALGLNWRRTWQHVILPQVFYLILPPLTVEFTALVKASALLSVIGVLELTRTAQQIVAATFQPVPIWIGVGIIYFVLCFALGAVTDQLERRTALYRTA